MKKRPKGTGQWIPEFMYWNLRLIAKQWEKSQSDVIEEAILEWMNKQGLKGQDYYKENRAELEALNVKAAGSKFRDQNYSLKGLKLRQISVTRKCAQNLAIASVQTERPMSGILTNALVSELEAIGWKFYPLEEAKKEVLRKTGYDLTGELLDESESGAYVEESIEDDLYNELVQKKLIRQGLSYTYDQLLAIKAESIEVREVPLEAIEALERIKKLTNKEGETKDDPQ